mmetsp:Transcript_38019/g.73647  ORF Transcript_38019/g.73647 Transcript_38019/m.73647 type:complete len:181 (+) Transcript_38019:1061-1603(+)
MTTAGCTIILLRVYWDLPVWCRMSSVTHCYDSGVSITLTTKHIEKHCTIKDGPRNSLKTDQKTIIVRMTCMKRPPAIPRHSIKTTWISHLYCEMRIQDYKEYTKGGRETSQKERHLAMRASATQCISQTSRTLGRCMRSALTFERSRRMSMLRTQRVAHYDCTFHSKCDDHDFHSRSSPP